MKEFLEKLIERLEESVSFTKTAKMESRVGKKQTIGFVLGVRSAVKIVKDLASEHNNGWISVEDALPEDNQCPVLACTRNDVMYTAVYDAVYDKWYDDNFEREIFITDWQPLPPAPKKGE